MVKRHITARIAEETAAALDRWADGHGISKSEAIERLLVAGMATPETDTGGHRSDGSNVMDQTPTEDDAGPSVGPQEATGGHARGEVDTDGLRAIIDVLRASNADLRATVSTLTAQLDVKDRQIEAAHGLADHAQKLHAAEVQKALPAEGQTRGGWLSSFFRRR